MSSTSPNLRIGTGPKSKILALVYEEAFYSKALSLASRLFIFFTLPSRSNPSVPVIAPGTIPTTLTLWGPHSQANTFVRASTPAFAAEL